MDKGGAESELEPKKIIISALQHCFLRRFVNYTNFVFLSDRKLNFKLFQTYLELS